MLAHCAVSTNFWPCTQDRRISFAQIHCLKSVSTASCQRAFDIYQPFGQVSWVEQIKQEKQRPTGKGGRGGREAGKQGAGRVKVGKKGAGRVQVGQKGVKVGKKGAGRVKVGKKGVRAGSEGQHLLTQSHLFQQGFGSRRQVGLPQALGRLGVRP